MKKYLFIFILFLTNPSMSEEKQQKNCAHEQCAHEQCEHKKCSNKKCAHEQCEHKKCTHEHREHGAHEHGSAKLAIAFEETKGKIEFKGAAKGILGFEHKSKNKQDEALVSEVTAQFENNIGKMIQMDDSLACQFTKEMIGQVSEDSNTGSGEHSDWLANFSVTCSKSPIGTKLIIDFSYFKNLNDIDISVLAGSLQKSAEFKKKPVSIELK